MISDDARRTLEAHHSIKREREEREEKRKKRKKEDQKQQEERLKCAEVKGIMPVLRQVGKAWEGKVSAFPQIRDFLKNAYKPTKAEQL